MWIQHKFFKYITGLILVLLAIFLLGKIDYFLTPFRVFIATLFFPILISGLLYYLLRPLVHLLERLRFPRVLAILAVFLLVLVVLAAVSVGTGSMVVSQFNELFVDLPKYAEMARASVEDWINQGNLASLPLDHLQEQLTGILGKAAPFLSQGLISGISAVTNTATILFIVPFILFYLLKDEKLFSKRMLELIPPKHKANGEEILDDVDKTLSTYIIGQAIIALTIGLLMYIGYMVLGLKYALILALFAMLTAFIPIIGAFIGVIPAILVGLTMDPTMVLKILVLMIVAQQLEGSLISPQIMGKRMNIHPLTFIILLLAAAALYGFIGMLIAVPVYAVVKVIVKNVYRIYKLQKG